MESDAKLLFTSDYMEGAHPNIINRLAETNMLKTAGYGLDQFCASAKSRIRKACKCPNADIFFLVGGTQTNETVIDAILKPWQGVIAPGSGHISVHEAGAIEFTGHKVLTLPHKFGKINSDDIEKLLEDFAADENRDHMVMPGMVYISQPTEYGTLYSLNELKDISSVCRKHSIPLYVDGARLAYALASHYNTVTLEDMAKLCDAFYIGGTKCGTLCGEAVVIPNQNIITNFFTIAKQHGALLAKGRLLGLQFDELFKDELYLKIGKSAIENAERITKAFSKYGYRLYFESPTNQIFVIVDDEIKNRIAEKVEFGFWEKYDDTHTVIRFAVSWATRDEEVDELIKIISSL